jgi:hypothetical protein
MTTETARLSVEPRGRYYERRDAGRRPCWRLEVSTDGGATWRKAGQRPFTIASVEDSLRREMKR